MRTGWIRPLTQNRGSDFWIGFAVGIPLLFFSCLVLFYLFKENGMENWFLASLVLLFFVLRFSFLGSVSGIRDYLKTQDHFFVRYFLGAEYILRLALYISLIISIPYLIWYLLR